jgi:hypothetical protein
LDFSFSKLEHQFHCFFLVIKVDHNFTMSFKAKDLQYDDRQPAFLRRLRGEISGSVSDPDRQINPVARAKGPSRLKNDDEDDGPTYVMENTNESLSKEEYEALVNGKDEKEHKSADAADSASKNAAEDAESTRAKQKVAAVGGPGKKRKAVKIVGDDEEAEEEGSTKAKTEIPSNSLNSDTKRPAKKKKAKAIKVSFGSDDDEK